jgi:hypothetical protein
MYGLVLNAGKKVLPLKEIKSGFSLASRFANIAAKM